MMTMNRIFQKLRGKNTGQYRMLGFCVFLSVLLISSFSLMYFGPTVQDFLPEGGDTRKMASLLLAVTAVGCCVFTLYASSLFFRYKSREYGILLALGESKKSLGKLLFWEVAGVTAAATLLGLIAALPTSWIIWKFFENFIISTNEMTYRFGFTGFLVGTGFALLLSLLLGLAGRRFINQSDIMDILKTQNKTEMVKVIPSWTFPVGIVLTVLGLLLAIGLPSISVNLFYQNISGICNFFYVMTLAGIYLILLNIVAQNRLGKNKEKFYKNMVSVSMMRFFAKSTTRNMCVIVLLLFVSIFATFYGLLYSDSTGLNNTENTKTFALHFPSLEHQITKEAIDKTANKHQVTVTDFGEGEAANLVISYKSRDMTDQGQYITLENEQTKLALFLSVDSYNSLTGRQADVAPGTYKTVTITDYKENIWNFMDGLWEAANPVTGQSLALSYEGSLEYDALAKMSDPYAYILNNQDYAALTDGISQDYMEHLMLFNTTDYESSYLFAMDLLDQYVNHTTDLSNHMGLYDFWAEKLAKERGEDYILANPIDLSMDNIMLLNDWKYAPDFMVVLQQDYMQLICIYVMLCLYIFIISLAAVAIMTYVRSISIAASNRELFVHLDKLGAPKAYQKRILKSQLIKIFQYPSVLGCSLGLLFSALMCWFNDGRYTASELHSLGILLGLTILVFALLYVIYRAAIKQAEEIVGLK